MSHTHTERRQRVARIRHAAVILIAVGVLGVSIAVYALFLEVHLVGASASMFTNCGTVVEPFDYGFSAAEAAICGSQLQGHAVFALCLGIAALILGAAGAELLRKNPAPQGF